MVKHLVHVFILATQDLLYKRALSLNTRGSPALMSVVMLLMLRPVLPVRGAPSGRCR
jgi:hypothetical protein